MSELATLAADWSRGDDVDREVRAEHAVRVVARTTPGADDLDEQGVLDALDEALHAAAPGVLSSDDLLIGPPGSAQRRAMRERLLRVWARAAQSAEVQS